MYWLLLNQHYQHRTNQKLHNIMGEHSFSKSWGLWASISFSPLPLPCHFFFCSHSNILEELMRKRLHMCKMAKESVTWYLFLSSLFLVKWIIHHLRYCFRKLFSTTARYSMIQMFCPGSKPSKSACLTVANLLNCVGGNHSFLILAFRWSIKMTIFKINA